MTEIKFDLHNHTTSSDGSLIVKDLIRDKEFLDILCLTEHYPDYPEAYVKSQRLAEEYRKTTPRCPLIIHGIELLLWKESPQEVLIFGTDAIAAIRKKRPGTARELSSVLKDKDYAAVICHPFYPDVFQNKAMLELAHGIEITTRGVLLSEKWGKELGEKIQQTAVKYSLNLFATSDCHKRFFNTSKTNSKETFHTFSKVNYPPVKNEMDFIQMLRTKLDVIPVLGKVPDELKLN